MLFVLGLATGLRISDILNLRARDIQTSTFTVTESKTKKRRTINLDPFAHSMLQSHEKASNLRPDDYLIYSTEINKGKPLSRVQAFKTMRRIGREIMPGSPIGTHSLRKTFAANLYRKTGSIYEVQKALNHKHIETTKAYLVGVINPA
jgi:integrase